MERTDDAELLKHPHLVDYDEDPEDYKEESLAVYTPLKTLKIERKQNTLAKDGFNSIGDSESSESEFENVEENKDLEIRLNLEV